VPRTYFPFPSGPNSGSAWRDRQARLRGATIEWIEERLDSAAIDAHPPLDAFVTGRRRRDRLIRTTIQGPPNHCISLRYEAHGIILIDPDQRSLIR
jgi:hypothetical protein